jgi:BMFP domain-containing protein YqiC
MTDHNPSPLYPKHLLWELEPHYSLHVSAMTTEQLHHKSDIAAQLAWRDQVIALLRVRVGELEATVDQARARVEELEAELNPALDAEDERILAMSDEELVAETNVTPEEWERLGAVGQGVRHWVALVTKERQRADAAEARIRTLEAELAEAITLARNGWDSARLIAICFGAFATEKEADEALSRVAALSKKGPTDEG